MDNFCRSCARWEVDAISSTRQSNSRMMSSSRAAAGAFSGLQTGPGAQGSGAWQALRNMERVVWMAPQYEIVPLSRTQDIAGAIAAFHPIFGSAWAGAAA